MLNLTPNPNQDHLDFLMIMDRGFIPHNQQQQPSQHQPPPGSLQQLSKPDSSDPTSEEKKEDVHHGLSGTYYIKDAEYWSMVTFCSNSVRLPFY